MYTFATLYHKFHLRQNIYIRKFFAAALVIVFAFSITSSKVLHYFFANHKDATASKVNASGLPVLSVAVFHCQCDNLVVEFPFILSCKPVMAGIPELFVLNNPVPELPFSSFEYFFFEQRGPPFHA